MNCRDARRFVGAHVDLETDLGNALDLEEHIAECGGCERALNAEREVKAAVRAAALSHAAPRGLERRVMAAVRREAASRGSGHVPFARPSRSWTWAAVLGAASIALVAAIIWWQLLRPSSTSGATDALVEEAVSSHVRSLLAAHLYDVASSDRHTVKPWFAGKLDYSPPVVDMKDAGFPLAGGRLDYLDGRPVAALVYRRRLHAINLFVWPMDRSARRGQQGVATLHGYHLLGWDAGGMEFEAVSDLGADDLALFALDLRARLTP